MWCLPSWGALPSEPPASALIYMYNMSMYTLEALPEEVRIACGSGPRRRCSADANESAPDRRDVITTWLDVCETSALG
jgi:hypothetical protein